MPKEIITVYFKDADIDIYNSFKEIANGKISPTAVVAIAEYNKKYNINPINAEKSEIDEKIDSEINLINNSNYWNKIIPNLSTEQLKILESAAHSLEIKTSNMLHSGKLRA